MEIRLCIFREQSVAGLVEDFLRQNGLHPRPLNTSGHISMAGAGQWYDLWVPKEEKEKAREVLSAAGYQESLAGE